MVWDKGKYFLLPWSVFLAVGCISILAFGKTELHILLNERQPRSADPFFKIVTLFGEGMAVGFAIFYLLFRSGYAALFLASSWLLTFLVVQFLKLVVFTEALRPFSVFKDHGGVYFIEGVKYHTQHSFPSGHTGEIFSVCFALTLLSRNPKIGLFLFIPAMLVAYSRVFLSQHFMEDILASSGIAILCTILCFWLWQRYSVRFREYIGLRG